MVFLYRIYWTAEHGEHVIQYIFFSKNATWVYVQGNTARGSFAFLLSRRQNVPFDITTS